MNKIIIANWKMNLVDLSEWKNFSFSKTEIVICPSFLQLEKARSFFQQKVKIGAQDVFEEERGARTGEVSLQMLKKAGAEYVIVGHSERRYIMAETDEMINKKLKVSLEAGLKPILCIGERERESLEQAKEFVKSQLEKDIPDLQLKTKDLQFITAYEPVWAISDSRGTADKPEESLEIIRFIRKWLEEKGLQNVRTIYGGSVDEENIESFIKYPEIEGVLVGNASLNPASFRKIIEIAEKF